MPKLTKISAKKLTKISGEKLRSDQFSYHEMPKMAKSYLTTTWMSFRQNCKVCFKQKKFTNNLPQFPSQKSSQTHPKVNPQIDKDLNP